jgi:hypothetical protein
MLKKEIYPKTPRIKELGEKFYLTEKLDGSNLVFFKKDDELYIALRSNIIAFAEIDEQKGMLYKGLYQWLQNNGTKLKEQLNEGSAVCGEWLGMGNIKYDSNIFSKHFYMFAKANIDESFSLYNLKYDHNLFVYPFIDKEIPDFIGVVPEVTELNIMPNKEILDNIYEEYLNKVNRPVEGFVINYQNIICKYVRMKNNKIVEYSESDHKNS